MAHPIRNGDAIERFDTVIDSGGDLGPRQSAVYRNYLQLQSIAVERFHSLAEIGLAGRLLLCATLDRKGVELALASTIAGGAFLGIDSSPEHLKAAVRNGSCNFMVNTLDESLRVLKNELRKQNAVSVGLLGDASENLAAIVERGVQPDLIAYNSRVKDDDVRAAPYRALLRLIERGALSADTETANLSQHAAQIEVVWTAANAADLKRLDQLALESLPVEDRVRRRWLQQASGCFHRQLPLERVMGLSSEELTQLLNAFQEASSSGNVPAPASVRWKNLDGAEHAIALRSS